MTGIKEQERAESDCDDESLQDLLHKLDETYAAAVVPFSRASLHMRRTGDVAPAQQAADDWRQRCVIGDQTRCDLYRASQDDERPFFAQWASLFLHTLPTDHSAGARQAVGGVQYSWQALRSMLVLADGAIAGADLLFLAYTEKPRAQTAASAFDALHAKDGALAVLMMQMRDRRNAWATLEGYEDFFVFALETRGYREHEFDTLASLFQPVLEEAHGLKNRLKDKTRYDTFPFETLDTKRLVRTVAETIGMGEAFGRIEIYDAMKPGSGQPACIAIDPPREVAVVVYPRGNSLYAFSTYFSELGHGLHYAQINGTLPFIMRTNVPPETPWKEAMDDMFRTLAFAFIDERPSGFDLGAFTRHMVATIRIAAVLENASSMYGILRRLCFERFFYQVSSADPAAIDQQWLSVNGGRLMYGMPEGYIGEVHEWANDYYLALHPVDLDHILGVLIAAQIRAWWKRTHEEPLLSQAFGDFLRTQCYAPGGSKPWRELLREATGEDLNPQYLFDELEEAKRAREHII